MRENGFLFTFVAVIAICQLPVPAAAQEPMLEEIVVTSQRRPQMVSSHNGSIAKLAAQELAAVRHQHVHELFTRISGVWLSRGSGQENLTAIRSPVLTGAGSCGAFLTLEDGIPSRPSGFCNVNQFFELNTEQAAAIEVLRGPGNALHGSNALHGIVNVLMPVGADAGTRLGVELGANDYSRLRATVPFSSRYAPILTVVYARDGGFRDDSGYEQSKAHFAIQNKFAGGELRTAVSASDLDQETAGFILGENAYKDPSLNRDNLNPEAFRKASSQRIYAIWNRDFGSVNVDIRPYARHSRMEFLQHFLPGQPLEENGHVSAGVISSVGIQSYKRRFIAGVDVEWADVYLEEFQPGPTQGSAFVQETRPEGQHYDYDVTSFAIAPFLQAEYEINPKTTLIAGLRAEYIRYDYDNQMLDGNTRDDGSVCGFGGCLYSRPADRGDSFTNIAPKLGATFAVNDNDRVYVNLGRGFRAPQMTELYRLQSGQQVADLDSEQLDSLEIGLRINRRKIFVDTAIFHMQKRDSIFRDADGFNVSGARSQHRGVELSVDWQIHDAWRLAVDSSYAKHTYDFDRVALRGETFESGNDVDTAPRWLASAELFVRPSDLLSLSLQWTMIGSYFLDAENRFEYPGHDILNFRAGLELGRGFSANLRLNNVTDRDYADRADFAFGNYRYFPGRGRELFVELSYSGNKGVQKATSNCRPNRNCDVDHNPHLSE